MEKELNSVSVQVEVLARQFLDGNQVSAWYCIEQAYDEYGSVSRVYDLMTDAMRYIGDLWLANEITVADEHLATGICDFVMARFVHYVNTHEPKDTSRDVLSKPRAMFLCPDGENHYLGGRMVAHLFQQGGFETRFLGPNLPLHHAIHFATEWKPQVVGISVALAYQLPQLELYTDAFVQIDPNTSVLVGGRLTTKYHLASYCHPKTDILENTSDVVQFVEAYFSRSSVSEVHENDAIS